jgi:hypothetical protein
MMIGINHDGGASARVPSPAFAGIRHMPLTSYNVYIKVYIKFTGSGTRRN